MLREIGDRAFARTKIFSIIIPNGVIKIGNACFHHCDLLHNVILPSTVKMIGEYAFDYTKVYEIAVCEGCKYGGKVENDTKSGKELRDGDKILIDDEKGTLTVCVLSEEKLNQYNENKKSMRSEKKTEPVQRDEMSDDAFNDYDVSVSDNDIIYYSDEGENSDSETINQ